ncbi:hypothetical protein BU23DRAFT_285368 [Bimuria novae-zelandiae CBS 107.79]|uniref:polynucleotide adenylyltransferase n=1 Tax=Bimuria novae-zelandiae CBS 107.79 TaxID=1447943 RepID=A0A6A5UVK3_9PLEO|nr:hypothetical protein BU23DRAFT_285368 [Bimuria novae-zelandiae CBS 107.79]
MNDARHAHVQRTYLYDPHLANIHSAHPRIGGKASAPAQGPEGFALKNRYPTAHFSTALPRDFRPTQLSPQLPPPNNTQANPSRPYPTVTVSGPPSTGAQAHTKERNAARAQHAEPKREGPHGRKAGPESVRSSALSMTSHGAHNMGNKREEGVPFARPSRPSIVSQHSNSVPSTPLQNARQYESRSRSPSPSGGLGSHSPRSVSSEANPAGSLTRPGRTVRCKFETSSQFGRRRMPYDSSDILDKAKEEQKKALDPHEDDKLSGDMRELYDRLQPTKENTQRRDQFVKKLQSILETEFPGNDFKVHVFGSSGNQLYTSESDVDVCIQTPMTRLEEMHPLAEALAKNGMEKVVCIPQAKVRIVKVWDPVLKLACDMNVNNTLALENTRMIKTYIQIDERVRPLAMIIKHWTKQRILNDAALGGTISSYTWICMIINFLQTRDPPILPTLHKLAHRAIDKATGKRSQSEFADDLEALKGFGKKNTESLGQLLFHFFRHYGHEVDYEKYVVSVRQGRLLTREEKNWHRAGLQKEARNRLCVEEPFNTDRNLGNSADEFAWRGIHLEIRRAFDYLADGQKLGAACEQFEFPPAPAPEERPRPPKPTAPKVTLAPSVPNNRNGRNSGNHRGGRGGMNNKGGGYGRRSSSGASFNRPPFLHSPPIGAMAGQQEYSFPSGLNERLHDQLIQQYQMLEIQSNTLRQQLVAQQRAQQAQQAQVAHIHAQVVAQAQAQAQHNRGPSSANASPQKSPYVNGRSSPRLAEASMPPNLPQGFLYHYPAFFDPSQGSANADGPRTNPSSPSLPHSMPGPRRQPHRTSAASETGSMRSQSQPARGMPPQAVLAGYPPMPQFFEPSLVAGYPIARSTADVPGSQAITDAPYSPAGGYAENAPPSEPSIPREYVGYYVDDQATLRSLQEYAVPQIPSYNELAQRKRRVSSEITQPLLNTALRRVSRSPSPLGSHVRSYSSNIALPQGVNADPRRDRTDSTRPVDTGPVIVNGSFPQQMPESRSRSDTVDSFPSVDTASSAAPFTDQESYRTSGHDQRQKLVFDEVHRQRLDGGYGAAFANGSMNGASPIDANGLTKVPSGGHQYYPMLPEAWVNYELGNGRRTNQTEDVSPTKTQISQWRGMPYNSGLTSLDTLNTPRPPPQEVKSATLPLLSPVFETRTPSPTSSRQVEGGRCANGAKGQSKENIHQGRRASHSAAQHSNAKENKQHQAKGGSNQSNDKSNKPNANNGNSPNTWQQPNQRHKRKNKKGSKSNDTKPAGEPLPANTADRKGG